jgi:hypothetical protein
MEARCQEARAARRWGRWAGGVDAVSGVAEGAGTSRPLRHRCRRRSRPDGQLQPDAGRRLRSRRPQGQRPPAPVLAGDALDRKARRHRKRRPRKAAGRLHAAGRVHARNQGRARGQVHPLTRGEPGHHAHLGGSFLPPGGDEPDPAGLAHGAGQEQVARGGQGQGQGAAAPGEGLDPPRGRVGVALEGDGQGVGDGVLMHAGWLGRSAAPLNAPRAGPRRRPGCGPAGPPPGRPQATAPAPHSDPVVRPAGPRPCPQPGSAPAPSTPPGPQPAPRDLRRALPGLRPARPPPLVPGQPAATRARVQPPGGGA